MRRLASLLLAIPMAVSLLAASSASASVGPHRHHNLTALRVATARFHSLKATAASGRVDLHLCVDMMGQHYANQATFADDVLDPIHPEAMVYEDNGHGHLHLVAVEWVSTTPGEVMHIPLHFNPDVGLWVLHAWIWKHNPAGMFADMNPRVGNCPV
jgi:hypothetical protein